MTPDTSSQERATRDLRRHVAECMGTAVLVLVGTGAAMVATSTHAFGHAGVSLAFGAIVCVLVAALGTISGAHLNPAVTVALWSIGRFPRREVPPYLLAQCLGAVGASLALRAALGSVGRMGATIPTIGVARSLAVEGVYSAILATGIALLALDPRTPRSLPPLAIGAAVFVGALVTGPLTGGSFNPARSLGPAIVGQEWQGHWLYWVGPIAGMLLGARLAVWLRSGPAIEARVLGVEGPIDR